MSTPRSSEPIPLAPADDNDVIEKLDDTEIPVDVQPIAEVEATAAEEATDITLHWALLVAAASVLVLAVILQVRGQDTVVIPVVDVPLPGTCTFKRFVGKECPGCGLTRCFISMAHGRPVAAWYFNPAGILFFGIVASQIPFRAMQIWRIRRGLAEVRWRRLGNYLFGFLIAALLVQWVIRTFVL